MLKSVRVPLLAAAAAATAALPASAAGARPIGPFANVCEDGRPAVVARVTGFKVPRGIVSVKLYTSNQSTFLKKGAYLRKVEVPVNSRQPIDVCIPVPRRGDYALSVRHEVSGRKSRSDGGGFSGNPSVSLIDVALQRKPPIRKVSFSVNDAPRVVPVTLKYLQGGSFRTAS